MSKSPLVFERLADHDTAAFSCGEDVLDRYLRTQAGQDMRRGFATVIVAVRPDTPRQVQGFYTVSAASLDLTELPDVLRRKLPRYGQVPAAQLGRLAVASDRQGQGLGALLLADALLRTYRSELAWAFFLVRAKHQQAASFYRHFEFTPLHGDPLLLWISRQQVKKLAELQ